MNRIKSRFVNLISTGLAFLITLLATLLIVPGGASAKDHKPKGSNNQAQVVAHISFAGLSAVDMSMQKKLNDKYFLYVQHSKGQGVSIIDITKPAQAKDVGLLAWPDPAVSRKMNLSGDLAIIAENDAFPTQISSANDDLVLWDLSNPAAPRVVQKFSGVVKWLQDERNFIYVLNGDGLWVVSKPQERQPEQAGSSDSY
ncbi:MAG TPA: hypothetical protein VKR59_06715 [Terriglobales bacterium]|nr:hypothetical protein [Terriglobales bacterium]